MFVFHYIPTSEQSVNSSLLSIQSLFIEFLAFGQLMIRRGGAFITTLSFSFHVFFFNLRRLIFYNKLSYKESTLFRKTVYAILIILALSFIVTVIILASYAAYIYITIVFVVGLLIINARKRELACCFLRRSATSKDRCSPRHYRALRSV